MSSKIEKSYIIDENQASEIEETMSEELELIEDILCITQFDAGLYFE